MAKLKNIIEFHPKFYTAEELAQIRREAWSWAKEEQEHFSPGAKRVNFKHLENCPDKYEAHMSIFVNPDDPTDALARVWWPGDNKIIHYILCNFAEIKQASPDLVEHFMVNGDYAYLKTERPLACMQLYSS